MRLQFFVAGKPVPKGSGGWGVSKSTGRAYPQERKGLKPWEARVALFAEMAARENPGAWPGCFEGPVRVGLVFLFARPKCHYRTGRFAHRLRPDAPDLPMGKTSYGDLDKLMRAILDGLTGCLIKDDTQVCSSPGLDRIFCAQGERPGVLVTISSIEQGDELLAKEVPDDDVR